jgi:phosphoenolpyruvate carboxylase
MIQKYDAIADALTQSRQPLRTTSKSVEADLTRLIAEAWHTDEIRHQRPTPQDEAKWGFAVIEQSLWQALPRTLAALDDALEARGLSPLDLHAAPIHFAIWMGGDRDGNPNVTAPVTREVLMLARWMAADLLLRDVEQLLAGLSMQACTPALAELADDDQEPYRAVLRQLRNRLRRTRDWAEGLDPRPIAGICYDLDSIQAPLLACYESLAACGMLRIANGPLRDTLRRVACFGPTLIQLDIRQNAERHTQVLHELTKYLCIDINGRHYGDWQETERVTFLLVELENRRPLLPGDWPASDDSAEVLATMAVIAEQDAAGISEYIISMAAQPSDVLAVILLLRAAGLKRQLPVVPLFETLEDLRNAAHCIDALLVQPWYQDYCGGYQQVMIGYSDSAKDAGQLAAAWAQYQAQAELTEVCRQHGVALALFHGRGGAVGRGGGPAQQAILSQPPGSLAGRLRVTEQGEMIRFKLGRAELATDTLNRYLSATLDATLQPPQPPTEEWRALIEQMAATAHQSYRQVVNEDPDFVALFRDLTPEQELGTLALGSRPARRTASRDVASLRAIPWVFAWTQIRLMLPAWLGTDAALGSVADRHDSIRDMLAWPFFSMQMDMLEMVLAKADPVLVGYYAEHLTNSDQQAAVSRLCGRLETLTGEMLALRQYDELLARDPVLADALRVRNTYLDPLHLLQAELLKRFRSAGKSVDPELAQALKVTMAGIATGLRNTG